MPPRLPVSSFRAGGNATAPASALGTARMAQAPNPSQLPRPPMAPPPSVPPQQLTPPAMQAQPGGGGGSPGTQQLASLLAQAGQIYLANGPNPVDTRVVMDFVQMIAESIGPANEQQAPSAPAPTAGPAGGGRMLPSLGPGG